MTVDLRSPIWRDLAELVRLPAVLTVPGDTVLGARAAGRSPGALPLASACLYLAGMAANDWADREVDAQERPNRPIPSGRVPAWAALLLAVALTFAGLAIARAARGKAGLAIAIPLAIAVWAYDLVLKQTPAGPAAMAAARGLDVLLGAAGAPHLAVGQAGAMALHTAIVTTVSRDEVAGAGPALPAAALAATLALAGATWALTPANRRLATTGPLAVYAAVAGLGHLQATANPTPAALQRAVGGGIKGMIPLQSALLTSSGARFWSAAIALLLPAAQELARRRAIT